MNAVSELLANSWESIAAIWGVNGLVFAVIRLSDVRDIVAIVLGLTSIASTLVILEVNRRKLKNKPKNEDS